MANSTIPQVLNALQEAIEDRLTGVSVLSGPYATEPKPEGVEFIRVEADQDFASIGNHSRDEEYTVIGHIWTKEPGDGEDVIRTVRDRAYDWYQQIEDYVRETPKLGQDDVLWAGCRASSVTQGFEGSRLRNFQLRFEIAVKARI